MNQNHQVPLSNRLKKVAAYLPKAANFADIGSDHAYLPAFICQQDPDAKAIAGEINKGPLESAKKTIEYHGLEQQIEARLGDGLAVVKAGEVEQIVIAGMGGGLITSILEKNQEVAVSVKRIIAQPNVNARSVRNWFEQNHFTLAAEEIVDEQGHIYEILIADRHTDQLSPYSLNKENKAKELLLGPYLLAEQPDAFLKKWKQELTKLDRVIHQMKEAKQVDHDKISTFETEKNWIKEALGK